MPNPNVKDSMLDAVTRTGRAGPAKIILVHVPQSVCSAAPNLGLHQLRTNEVKEQLITKCVYCQKTWGQLDQELNPSGVGRRSRGLD